MGCQRGAGGKEEGYAGIEWFRIRGGVAGVDGRGEGDYFGHGKIQG